MRQETGLGGAFGGARSSGNLCRAMKRGSVIVSGFLKEGCQMNLDNPGILISGMVIGVFGLAMFIYGKKAPDMGILFGGVVLSVLPLVAHTMLALWGIAGACGVGLVVLKKYV